MAFLTSRSLLVVLSLRLRYPVNLCFAFLPPWHCIPFSQNPDFGKAHQKQPVSSRFHMFSAVYPLRISGRCSFHESTVCPLTSPDSPLTLVCLILYLFFQQASHPLKSGILSCAAICFAFSHSSAVRHAVRVQYNH